MTSLPSSPSEQKAGEEEGAARLCSLEEHPLGARFTVRGELFCEGETLRPRLQTRRWECEQSSSERCRAAAGSEVLLCALRRLNEQSEVEGAFSGGEKEGQMQPARLCFCVGRIPSFTADAVNNAEGGWAAAVSRVPCPHPTPPATRGWLIGEWAAAATYRQERLQAGMINQNWTSHLTRLLGILQPEVSWSRAKNAP